VYNLIVCPERYNTNQIKLTNAHPDRNDGNLVNNYYFGQYVAINTDGSVVAVGAPRGNMEEPWNNNHDLRYSGVVYIYRRIGTIGTTDPSAMYNQGSPQMIIGERAGYLSYSGGVNYRGDQMGPVALSGDGNTLIAGSPYNDDGPNGFGSSTGEPLAKDYGSVRIFERLHPDTQPDIWTQKGEDINGFVGNPNELSNDDLGEHFGSSVSISKDGNRIAVGAPDGNGLVVQSGWNSKLQGAARVYEWDSGTKQWNKVKYSKCFVFSVFF